MANWRHDSIVRPDMSAVRWSSGFTVARLSRVTWIHTTVRSAHSQTSLVKYGGERGIRTPDSRKGNAAAGQSWVGVNTLCLVCDRPRKNIGDLLPPGRMGGCKYTLESNSSPSAALWQFSQSAAAFLGPVPANR